MGDPSSDNYFPSGPSRTPHSGHPSNSDEQNILPHLLSPLPCEAAQFIPYLGSSEITQNISVQFMHSCSGQDTTQLDSDILHRRLNYDEGHPTMVAHPLAYPESSQRTTSHVLSHYANDASRFNYVSSDLASLHLADSPTPSHAAQIMRRSSLPTTWPSHAQENYPHWIQLPSRMPRSPASEPPESTSDESYQDSDVEDTTQMSPMMNEFQVRPLGSTNIPPPHMYHRQALQPSVMTFQLSDTVLQPINDPENQHALGSLLDMNIIADEDSEIAHLSPPFAFQSSSLTGAGTVSLQGPDTRHRHGGERETRTTRFHTPVKSSPPLSNSFPPPSPNISTTRHRSPQRPSSSKLQKKSKMHQCSQCSKLFPRPSGLATHMNSHLGAKPYKCIVAGCDKSFAVRSNAKRHLRTHGIDPSVSDNVPPSPLFTVGFEEPMVTQVHDVGRQPSRLRWIEQNPSVREHEWMRQESSFSTATAGTSRAGLTFQASMSSATSSTLSNGSDDDYDEVASSSVADLQQYQNDYNGDSEEYTGSYPVYRDHH